MAKIVSFSLPENLLGEIDELTSSLKFTGRSETLRAGIKLLSRDHKQQISIKGKITATLVVVHCHDSDIASISHSYQKIIQTHMHHHLDSDKCLDIFIVDGKSEEIRSFHELLQSKKNVDMVQLCVIDNKSKNNKI